MAGALIGGALLGDAVSKSSSLIIREIKKTWYFKSQLKEMRINVDSMRPIALQLDKLNQELDRPKEETEGLIHLLNQADDLVKKSSKINWNIFKISSHSSKFDNLNKSLRDFVQINLQLQGVRNGAETLVELKSLKRGFEKGGCSSGVPLQKGVVIGFNDRVKDLKIKLLTDSPVDDCSIVVVSGAGGSGKTTFVKSFCNDPEIQKRFGKENIYFVTISQNYNKKVVVTKLLKELHTDTNNDDDAIQHWESFLGKNESEILLVLDDVWSDEVINDFKFKLPRYKILVTSRITFKQFKTYQFQLLNDQDSTWLFRCSAFSESGNEDNNIPEDIVDKLVKCCKNHPLVLTVIGTMLHGTHLACWESMLIKLSEDKKPLSDINESILECLKKSLFIFDKEPKMKQYYMHLALFPEDQKIYATTLMDMWVHLYNHDDRGLATMEIIDRLSSNNLATFFPTRKHSRAIVNHCDEEFVTQHDMIRELAIRLTSDESISNGETLIINAYGKDLSQLPQTINARVLSITTDETLPSLWNEIQAPKVEVFVLNYLSKIHPMPQFTHNMNKLKVLIITNYGYHFSDIQNFPVADYLSGLTRIRLDHVSISSISTTILMLENLQKLSLIMCKIGDSFNEGIRNKLTNLLEINIDSCEDLVTFPAALCKSGYLKKLSITNCHELTSLSDELGKLSNLEVLRIASCSKFIALPESATKLKQLRIIDISHCLNLCKLPNNIGELHSLQTICATGCMSLNTLPKSVENLNEIHLVCDEETSLRLRDFKNVKVEVVREDPVDTFFKINPRGH